MGSAKRQAAPAGLPGDKEQIRLRKEQVRRRMGLGVLGLGLWVALIVLVGPARVTMDAPPLGPAARDLVALRDFDAEEPVPDLVTQQEAAVAAIPLVYGFDQNAAARRIDALRTAFRLVRPRYRLFFAERERLVGSDHAVPAKPGRVGEADAVQGLDRAFNEEMERLRPEFESAVAPRRSELGPDVFATLRKAGFADEVELLLSDVAQVLLSQKIVREIERFEDDLQRGGAAPPPPAGARGRRGQRSEEVQVAAQAPALGKEKASGYVNGRQAQRAKVLHGGVAGVGGA